MNTRTLLVLALLCVSLPAPALDSNANQQSDIWEILFGATSLPALGDADHDGWTNSQESTSGTNPLDPHSFPTSALSSGVAGQVQLSWPSAAGKSYAIYGSPDLNPANYTLMSTVSGDGSHIAAPFDTSSHSRWFFKLAIADVDSDLDGLTDWEEMQLGFNPALNHSDRNDTADLSRVQSTLTAASTITVGLIDGDMREDWPDKGVVVIRRSGGLRPLTVNLTLTGTATRNTDYTTNIASTQIVLPMGARETWVELTPVNDASAEGVETIVVTVVAGSGYSIGSINNATVTLGDASSLPCAKEAARFLIQAAFGPDQDDAADADIIPENVEALMAQGIEAWIDDQFTRPIGYIQPYTNWALQYANGLQLYGNYKEHAWWERAMGVPKLRPDSATTQLPDPLRQRVAFALSEILVTSDRADTLAVDYEGMANYYDIFEANAFGNYLDILK